MSNDEQVLLDLNAPEFQDQLFELASDDIRKVHKTLKKLRKMTWTDVFRDHGLKWEQVKTVPGTYTIRVSQSYRAAVSREGAFMAFERLHKDHDEAYGKK